MMPEKPIPPHKKRCAKCIYSKRLHTTKTKGSNLRHTYCDYLCMTGERRPCPAEECTAYKGKKRKKK